MLTQFPQAVPEIPVSNVDKVAEYYVRALGFSFDWGNDEGGIGGISPRSAGVQAGSTARQKSAASTAPRRRP